MTTRKRSEEITESVLRQIGVGTLAPETVIPSEILMCNIYGVTRGVVREAIRTLEEKGFVKVSQGMPTKVAPPQEWNVLDPIWIELNSDNSYFEDLHATRMMLEPEIAALAAINAKNSNIDVLRRLINEQSLCLADSGNFANKDASWHSALANATQNPILNQIHNSIVILGTKMRVQATKSPEASERGIYWHKEILHAVLINDPDLARESMRNHLNQVHEDLLISLNYD